MSFLARTFNDMWYRVADFTPRLSPHLMVRRQTYRDETWFLLGDPASSKYFRFNGSAYRFLGLLDGQRTVQEAWEVCNAQLGDDAPNQTDCINLLSQLQLFGLLKNDLPIDPSRLRERIEKLKDQRRKERLGGYVFFSIPLINPERFLEKYVAVGRAVFSKFGFAVMIVLIISALYQVIPRWAELSSSFNGIIAPGNLLYLSIAMLIMKVIHEYAHAFACKACGGRVTEIGVFMMMVMPLPYCDATSSWSFTSKWDRILVAAAGMMVEIALASVAALIWVRTDPGLVHSVAYNVMFIASVVTVIFNMNPLLRYDGYYILSDLLEIPNLAPRSQDLMKYLTRRYAFGLKGEPPPPLQSRMEGVWMVMHACCAFPYRMMVVTGIVMLVAQQYFIFGFIIAVFGGIMWLVLPVFKGLSYVISAPQIQVVRPRAIAVTFGTLAFVIFMIGFVPMPRRVWANGVVEPAKIQTLRAATDGVLEVLQVRDGQFVTQGQILGRLSNPSMESDLIRADALLQMERTRNIAALSSTPAAFRLAEPELDDAERQYRVVRKTVDDLTLRAAFDGQVIGADLANSLGVWVQQGRGLFNVATLDDLVIRAYVDDLDFALMIDGPLLDEQSKNINIVDVDATLRSNIIHAKLEGLSSNTFQMEISQKFPVGSRGIRHESLGHLVEGGSIALDPNSGGEKRQTISPQWEMTLQFNDADLVNELARPTSMNGDGIDPDQSKLLALPGTRARIRITLTSQPLAVQWWRRARQLFAARFGS